MKLTETDLAYVAGLIDVMGRFSMHGGGNADGPRINATAGVSRQFGPALHWLSSITGNKIVVVRRDYDRKPCTEHCPEDHVHALGIQEHWSVAGGKATIIIFNILPYLRIQVSDAEKVLDRGLQIGYTKLSSEPMEKFGWEIPQPPKRKGPMRVLKCDRCRRNQKRCTHEAPSIP